MEARRFDWGLIGLGVMGRNLAWNLAGQGVRVAGFDRDGAAVEALNREAAAAADGPTAAPAGFPSPAEVAARLRPPRTVLLLVPAGPPVDAVIEDLERLLQPGDLLIDGGNSHFRDTDRRMERLARRGLQMLGVGISGGAYGARHGASLMAGGAREAWERVRPVLERAAAQADGEPCAAWLGPGSAGHYVKMVHNGIEYALMQLIAETYDLLQRGLGLDAPALRAIYSRWARGETGSFLLEITADILRRRDERTAGWLVDAIRDAAQQKGTGRWTAQDALELGVPTPTVDAAVGMRDLSAAEEMRRSAAARRPTGAPVRPSPAAGDGADPRLLVGHLRDALDAGSLLAYAQGFAQLAAASRAYGYGLDPARVAAVWRGGCIIRSKALEPIREAYRRAPDLPVLIANERIRRRLGRREEGLRAAARWAIDLGRPAPALAASLAWLDALRSPRLPAGLIQAQRDYFGAHGYERLDAPGRFHTDWRGGGET